MEWWGDGVMSDGDITPALHYFRILVIQLLSPL